MKGTAEAVHQSSKCSEDRKLASITLSPSVAVVSETAPRWMTASSLRPQSQACSSAGGTKSASWRLARLRHFSPLPSRSQTATSARPTSLSAATTFEPIKPAPPVTRSMKPRPVPSRAFHCPSRARQATRPGQHSETLSTHALRGCWTQACEGGNRPLDQMDSEKEHSRNSEETATSPILLVPYVWIGDFVRCHTVARVLRQRWPERPVDVLSSSLCAPLADYMPGVRKAIVYDLPRSRIAIGQQRELAAQLRREGYGDALIMPRTWKSALAPALAGIATRTGFVGEARFGLLNDLRWGEKALPRMVDRCAALALPAGSALPATWPVPELRVKPADAAAWRRARGLGDGRAVALAPGAVGPSKRWSYFGEAARALADRGLDVWVLGGPGETGLAAEIAGIGGPRVRDLTSND